MADYVRDNSTATVVTRDIGRVVDELVTMSERSRKSHERRWYDNNFFDDGHHFRYLSRSTNKVIDQSERATIYTPQRAIPKASRQIRGIANLLMSQNPTPTVYPERILPNSFPPVQMRDPQTGQMISVPNPQYQQAVDKAKEFAKKSGYWLKSEFDEQNIIEKLALMIILAAKNSVSYMQIWPDANSGAIKTQVFDAFDIYLMGNMNEIYDSPHLIKVAPQLITEIQNNPEFNQDQIQKLNPDNKFASSEIKQAYMQSRFGGQLDGGRQPTLLLKEAYLKERLNEDNIYRIAEQEDGQDILKGRKKGDIIVRQIFSAAGTWLKDKYISLPEYPFVDYRMEPGPIYQVPLIERFIPTNKSLDLIVSRLERITNTMIGGIWLKRQGEQFEMTNTSGGLTIEYSATKPEQAQMTPIPSYPFNLVSILESFIEEQGVTTATLGKIPPGVRANSAIESLKESEYSTLIISTRRLRQTVKRIAENMLSIADSNYVKPKTVYYEEKGNPNYFDVMGGGAMNKMQDLGLNVPQGVTPIKKNYHVEVEVEAGMAYTKEGQKQTMMDLVDRMIQFAQLGYLNPQSVKVVLEKFLQVYQFGSTGEFMEAMDDKDAMQNMTDTQIEAMKVAMMEVFKDLIKGKVLPDQETRIQENKVAVAEVMKDVGGMDGNAKPPAESISFKDLPPEGKAQMAEQAGIQINPEQIAEQENQERQIEMAKLAIQAQKSREKPKKKGNQV
jgi:hypothetical protein